ASSTAAWRWTILLSRLPSLHDHLGHRRVIVDGVGDLRERSSEGGNVELTVEEAVPHDKLVLVRAVEIERVPGEDVVAGVRQKLALRDEGGRTKTIGGDGVLDD